MVVLFPVVATKVILIIAISFVFLDFKRFFLYDLQSKVNLIAFLNTVRTMVIWIMIHFFISPEKTCPSKYVTHGNILQIVKKVPWNAMAKFKCLLNMAFIETIFLGVYFEN